MITIFERKEIAEGIWFNRITDSRFKVSQISAAFMTEFDELSRADYAAVPRILADSCESYPDCRSLSARCAELYGATLTDSINFGLNCRSSSLMTTFLGDRFALEGEKLESDCCRLLMDCIMRPLAKNGAFDHDVVRMVRSELIDEIDSVINDKRVLAMNNAMKTAFRGEPLETPITGSREEAEKVTPESAWNAYRRSLERARIEIFAVGASDFEETERAMTEELSALERKNICRLTVKPSRLKPSPEYVSDSIDMKQAIVRMYFKAPDMDNRFANVLFAAILGGMPTSRFFTNIREKQSLCYYCGCTSNRFSRTLSVYSGVEPDNAERTKQAVLDELQKVCDDGVTEEELEYAKLDIKSEILSCYDNASAIAGWYMGQIADEVFLTPEQYLEKIFAVTAEDVRNAARRYTLDTVYTLRGEEA